LQFRISNDVKELHAYMNKDILPNEWGGKAGTFQELNGKYIISFILYFNGKYIIFYNLFLVFIIFLF